MDRLEETKKKFCVLDDWTITMGSDRTLEGIPYTGQCTINLDKHIAIIYPWHTNEPEPFYYVLHEILHIAFRAASIDYKYEEPFVQDLCTQFKEKDQEIAQLSKEKEWFIDKVVNSYKCKYENKSVAEIKKILLTDMKEMLLVIEVLKEE